MSTVEEMLRDLAAQVKRDTIAACAKIAADAEEDRDSADAPYDNGAGSCGYAKACYDIEAQIRKLADRDPILPSQGSAP